MSDPTDPQHAPDVTAQPTTPNGTHEPASAALTASDNGHAPSQPSSSLPQSSTNTPASPASDGDDDLALLAAWKYLLDYDRVSTQQKRTYTTIRQWAILLSVGATTGAVLSGLQPTIRLGFAVLAMVIVPAVGFLLQNYDTLFVERPFRWRYVAFWLLVLALSVLVVAVLTPSLELGRALLAWVAALLLPGLGWGVSNLVASYSDARRAKAASQTQPIPPHIDLPEIITAAQPTSADRKKSRFKFGVVVSWFILVSGGLIVTAVILSLNAAQGDPFLWILQVPLVIVPIISVGLLNYAAEYARSTVWIEYRVAAEEIRSQIYLYRTSTGRYANAANRREELLKAVDETNKRISNSDFVPFMRSRPRDVLKQEIWEHCQQSPGTSDDETGLGMLQVEDYLKRRVRVQIQWYERSIERDYVQKRRATVGALVMAGTGSALVALNPGFAPLVALTTAGGIALTMWSNIRTIGATYSIFQRTASDLDTRINRWDSLSEIEKQTPEICGCCVQDIEDIFGQEREAWRTAVKQMQQSVDKALQDMRQSRDENKSGAGNNSGTSTTNAQ